MAPPTSPDNDHILWTPATTTTDDDFVLLDHPTRGHPPSPSSSSVDSLLSAVNNLSLSAVQASGPAKRPKRSGRKGQRSKSIDRSPAAAPEAPDTQKAGRKESVSKPPRRTKSPVPTPVAAPVEAPTKPTTGHLIGLGERPIVDDVSEYSTEDALYEHATTVMRQALSATGTDHHFTQLEILQALVIELGLVRDELELPTSITAARAMIRAKVFVNIVDYLDTREKGQEALQQVMHKNRHALIRDLRKRRKHRASLDWVKENGLSVLLVTCY